ncbi:Hypothetical predicted protein [Xyrichtys novacula]|uniref:Uncharacterized protein n=1 Tax=Xyrichtys novacula TaxID=13765 RepID=A0AAV1HPA1_XYRNO|nr:Hypothetical predicted protein [Xyrichtys novacula]
MCSNITRRNASPGNRRRTNTGKHLPLETKHRECSSDPADPQSVLGGGGARMSVPVQSERKTLRHASFREVEVSSGPLLTLVGSLGLIKFRKKNREPKTWTEEEN